MFSDRTTVFVLATIGVAVGLLVVVLLIVRVFARRRYRLTLPQFLLLKVSRTFNRLMWRTKINRLLPIGLDQGAVVIANHTSSFDPVFIQQCTNRLVHWFVAREFCVDWRLGWLMRIVEVIPAGRGGIDSAAVKHAIRLASEGKLVGLLPEGRINTTGELLLPGRPGAALVALKARVPVIPCYVGGASYDGRTMSPLWTRFRITMTVGDPIDISEFYGREKEDGVLEELTRRMLSAIAALAGRPDFVPQVAGKHWKPDENGNNDGGKLKDEEDAREK